MVGRVLGFALAAVAGQTSTRSVCEGCEPPKAYLDPIDRQIAATGEAVGNRVAPCTILKKQEYRDGVLHQEVEWLPTEKCVKFDAPRRWHGFWRNAFEGSQFCETVTHCTVTDHPQIWFSWKSRFGLKPKINGFYEIEFVGRRTSYQGGYGHMGVFDHEIIADRIISIRKVPRRKKSSGIPAFAGMTKRE